MQIEVKHLTKIFGKKQKQALKMTKEGKSKTEILEKTGCTVGVYDANFQVNKGEIFVIMGLSGSGKSTLVRMLNRLIEPSSGEIFVDGENVSKMDKEALREFRRNKINMVFQNFGLLPNRTILENTEFGLEIRGIDKEKRKKIAEKALEDAGLLPFKDQMPDQLSGGMQQRVGLARALANDPEILLMDEAFSALDPLIRRQMQDELLEIQQKTQKTILFITHDLNEALRVGDRIAIMKDGHIMQIGTGEEILMHPANEYVRKFVINVDRSKVLTAHNIMVPAHTTIIGRDGPRVALSAMKKNGVSMLIAVDKNNELLGSVSADDALRAQKEKLDLASVVSENVSTIQEDMLVTDLFEIINDNAAPLAVVRDKKVVGVVVRGCIIDALSDHYLDEEKDNEENEHSDKE